MKPLIIVTVYNRAELTRRTLRSLIETGAADQGRIVVYDNASSDGASAVVWEFVARRELGPDAVAIFGNKNIGCPRALNVIMWQYRKPSQPVIKVDNDNVFLSYGWVSNMQQFMADHKSIALLSPWYDEAFEGRRRIDHGDWIEIFPIVGHCVYHAGWFLDQAGFFDVLTPDHLYGFEDLLMAHRAVQSGCVCGVHRHTRIEIIQRQNSLDVASKLGKGENRNAHIGRLRSLYNKRIALTQLLRSRYFVNRYGAVVEER